MTIRIPAPAIAFLLALATGQSCAFASHNIQTTTQTHRSLQRPTSSHHKSIDLQNIHKTRSSAAALQLRAGATSTDSNTIPPPPPPSNLSLLKFYFPCLALWISGPLLSLVDTSFIGLSAKPEQPATTFIDGSLYLFAFLNVATTNLYASALAKGAVENTKNKSNKSGVEEKPGEGVVRTAAKTSLYSGIGLMLFLLAVAQAAASPGLLDAAHEYVKIRFCDSFGVNPVLNNCQCVGDYLLLAGTIAMIPAARRKLLSKGSSLGLLPRWMTKRQPDEISARTFLKFAAPVLTLILGKISAFGFMTNAAAGLPGQPATLAAHQIALSLFFFASPFLEVISQIAQAFLPTYTVLPKEERAEGRCSRMACGIGEICIPIGEGWFGCWSVDCLGVGSIVAFAPGIVTKDAGVQAAAKPLALILAAGVSLTAPVAVSEGALIARKELTYLAGVYFLSTALLPPVLRRIRSGGGPVSQVWICFALFQLFRSTCFLGRILATRGKTDAE
ncbi:multidrug and toxic compound extrusion (MATE) family protein [Skeletonema marinoi]|uniref:Multidrug and toxic compound extrusion (MATE) family protein n=1 Tax=Skeletonema marinoi TaxID=267567 RepID=A0AAD9DAJ7_9STRA|nr:multidrug and toxic compound extrusion (MATE) family protein [Skeletonema marinoi]